MKIFLLGKGSLAIQIAKYLLNNHDVILVPDKPEPTWTQSLTEWGKKNNLPIIESGDYRDIKDSNIELAISIYYGKIIKKEFIDRCQMIINLHNAPLPKYRGVRPINWALKNKELYHGVTIHKITEGIDDGPILGQILFGINSEKDEVIDVYNKCLYHGNLLFKSIFPKLKERYDNAKPQSNDFSYYSNKDIPLLGERTNFTRNESK